MSNKCKSRIKIFLDTVSLNILISSATFLNKILENSLQQNERVNQEKEKEVRKRDPAQTRGKGNVQEGGMGRRFPKRPLAEGAANV